MIPASPSFQSATEATWNALPSVEKLKKLELRDFSQIREYNLDREISIATAQFYCEQTKCNSSASQMAASVSYLGEDEFIDKLGIETQKQYSKQDISEKEWLAFTTKNRDNIYIDQTLLYKVIQKINKTQPEIAKKLGKKDLEIVIKKSILIHEFTHRNLHPQFKTFSAFSLSLPSYDQPINFNQLYGFEISGKSQDEKKVFYIEGGDEAVTERATQIIARKSESYIGVVQEFSSGASFVQQLNTKAGVTNDEFLKYLNGQLASEELVKKWGKGDFKKGIMMLAAIGLNVQGFTSTKETQRFIDNILKSS